MRSSPHHAPAGPARRRWGLFRRRLVKTLRRPIWKRLFWGVTVTGAVMTAGILALWWRLSSGPIELDLATPWLKAAIEENFGGLTGYLESVGVTGDDIEKLRASLLG